MGLVVLSIFFSIYSLWHVYMYWVILHASHVLGDWVYNGEMKQHDLCMHGIYSFIEEIELTLNSSWK